MSLKVSKTLASPSLPQGYLKKKKKKTSEGNKKEVGRKSDNKQGRAHRRAEPHSDHLYENTKAPEGYGRGVTVTNKIFSLLYLGT